MALMRQLANLCRRQGATAIEAFCLALEQEGTSLGVAAKMESGEFRADLGFTR